MRLKRIRFHDHWLEKNPVIRRVDWEAFAARLNPMPVGATFYDGCVVLTYVDDMQKAAPGSFLIHNHGTMH